MNKKQNKGITLVALVITIIVLIILAGVSINAVMNDGIIENAKNTKDEWQKQAEAEQTELAKLQEELDKVKYGEWTQEEDGTITRGTTTLHVGDVVTYAPTVREEGYTVLAEKSGHSENQTIYQNSDVTWKILGVDENGKLQIVANKPLSITLYGKTGYENHIEIFSNTCKYLYSSEDGEHIGDVFQGDFIKLFVGGMDNTPYRQTVSGTDLMVDCEIDIYYSSYCKSNSYMEWDDELGLYSVSFIYKTGMSPWPHWSYSVSTCELVRTRYMG